MSQEPAYQVPLGRELISTKTMVVRISISSFLFLCYIFLAFIGIATYINRYIRNVSRTGFWEFTRNFWHYHSNPTLMGIVGIIGIIVSVSSLIAQIAAIKHSSYQRVNRARFWYRVLIKTTLIMPCGVILLFIININTY
jgi:hypothetical protein